MKRAQLLRRVRKTTRLRKSQPQKDSKEYLKQIVTSVFGKKAPVATTQVDLEIWALGALFVREFILSWYQGKLNLLNQSEFIGELVYIVDFMKLCWHDRIQRCDWTRILLDDLFCLLSLHMDAVEQADSRGGSRFGGDFAENYMRFNGHFCLQKPATEPLYGKVLVKHLLALTLPEEELNSSLPKDFLTSLLNDLVIRNIVENLSDSFVIWDLLGKLADAANKPPNTKETGLYTRVVHFGSHFIAYSTSMLRSDKNSNDPPSETSSLSYSIFPFLSRLFKVDTTFPLTTVLLSKVRDLFTSSVRCTHWTNNLLVNIVYHDMLTEHNVSKGVQFLRHMMFPEDREFHLKPRYVPQTPEEYEAVKQTNLLKVRQLLVAKQPFLINQLYGGQDELDSSLNAFFDSFADKTVNKSLLWQLLDLLLVSIFPELTESTSEPEPKGGATVL